VSDLRLSLSCGYYDRTVPLLAGLVKPEGIDLDLPPLQPGGGMGSPDADVYEMPAAAMIIRRARTNSHIGVAVFPKRTFFQQLILTRRDAPLERFEDLRGKNVGLLNWYQHAMGIWTRGHLQDAYGIAPEEMRWFTQREMPYPLAESSPVQITVLPPEVDQVQMLLDGRIDVLIHESAHRFLRQHPRLRRMFPDHREGEIAYFRQTGCFPINHTLCVRREIIESHPWVAGALLRAFEESKATSLDVMERNNAVVSTPWMDDLLEAHNELAGPDVYPYGLERNRTQLETLVRYLHEQGLIPARLALEEIFAPDEVTVGAPD